MAQIRPFQAWRFAEKAGKMAELVCPPYDIISEEQRQAYLSRNPHNIIRLELPREGENPYETAGDVLARWRDAGILRQDDRAAYYVYAIDYDLDRVADVGGLFSGCRRVAGLISQVHLEEFDKGIVLPHEETLSKAKADRLNLMKATGFNFSDVYSLYRDEEGSLDTPALLEAVTAGEPLTEVTDEAGLCHRLWAVTDPEWQARITAGLTNTRLYIADGHHRYETAINYRNYLREQGNPVGADADYIMMMLVEMSHPGLTVFPTHRLLRDLPDFAPEALLTAAEKAFTVQRELPLGELDGALGAAYARGEKAFGFYVGGASFALLTLRDTAWMDEVMPEASAAARQLDVNVLHQLILERLLGIDKANMAQQKNLTYTRSQREALNGVRDGCYQACFILNPTRVSEIRDVAVAGEKMPQKSTYFYPKLITGLTINQVK